MSSFVNSKHKKLSLKEIFAIAAKETGGRYTSEQIEASVGSEIHQYKALAIREGNTLFIVHTVPNQPTVAVFRALNADVIPNYLKNSVEFTKAIGLMGYKYLITKFEDKSLLNIFEYVRRNAPFDDMGYAVQQMPDKQYKVTVSLGNGKSKKTKEAK